MQQSVSVDNVEKWPPFIEGWIAYEPPEVVQSIPKKTPKIKALLAYYQDMLDEQKEIRESVQYSLVGRAPVHQHEIITNLVMCNFSDREIKDRTQQLERALLARKRYSKSENGVTDREVEAARLYPIARLVKVKQNTTTCLWHADTHPSMHVYKDHAYCFVCQKRADAIDFMRELRRCDFVGAVRILNGS